MYNNIFGQYMCYDLTILNTIIYLSQEFWNDIPVGDTYSFRSLQRKYFLNIGLSAIIIIKIYGGVLFVH